MLDEAGQPVLVPQPPRAHSRVAPPPAQDQAYDVDPFQMKDMYMSLMESRMQELYKGQMANAKMIMGLYDTSPRQHCMSMEAFSTRMTWPADPFGAGAFGASAMEEDEDDDEDEEEDEEEEEDDEEDDEDSDDNRG